MMQQHVKIVAKDSQKIYLKIKPLEKLELIAILQVNTEMQHIVYVISISIFLTKFMQFFTTGQTIIILSFYNVS